MGLLSFRSRRSKEEKRAKSPDDDFWYTPLGSGLTAAGKRVTPARAEQIATVFACETAICQSMGMLPGSVLSEAEENKKVPLKTHPLWKLLRVKPNDLMDSLTFKDVMQRNLLQKGNSFAFISRSYGGKILSLTPLDSDRIVIEVANNKPIYRYSNPDGGTDYFDSSDIFHLKCFSKDGITGRSPIKVTAETLGFSLNLLEHSNNTFESGAALTGILKTPHTLKDDAARKRLIDSFREYIGRKSPAKIALTEGGVEFQQISQNNQQSQLMELSRFSVEEICRIFRVPPQFVQAMEKGMSYASVEQMAIAFVQYTIQPWVTLWESAIKAQLIEGDDITFKFNISALIRGDLKSLVEAIVQQLQYGLMTINEARDKLDYNAADEDIAEKLLLSHNLIPAENAGKVPPGDVGGKPDPAAKQNNKQFNSLFDTLFDRLIRRERKFIEEGTKKPEFEQKSRKFLAEHRDLLRETLEPAVEALGKVDSEQFEEFLKSYDAELRKLLSSSLISPELITEKLPKNCRETLYQFLDRDSDKEEADTQ